MTWKMFLFYQPRWKEKMRDLQGHWILKKQVPLLIRVSSEDDSFCKTFFQQKLTYYKLRQSYQPWQIRLSPFSQRLQNFEKFFTSKIFKSHDSELICQPSRETRVVKPGQERKLRFKKILQSISFRAQNFMNFQQTRLAAMLLGFFLGTLFDAITGVFSSNKKDKS